MTNNYVLFTYMHFNNNFGWTSTTVFSEGGLKDIKYPQSKEKRYSNQYGIEKKEYLNIQYDTVDSNAIKLGNNARQI